MDQDVINDHQVKKKKERNWSHKKQENNKSHVNLTKQIKSHKANNNAEKKAYVTSEKTLHSASVFVTAFPEICRSD